MRKLPGGIIGRLRHPCSYKFRLKEDFNTAMRSSAVCYSLRMTSFPLAPFLSSSVGVIVNTNTIGGRGSRPWRRRTPSRLVMVLAAMACRGVRRTHQLTATGASIALQRRRGGSPPSHPSLLSSSPSGWAVPLQRQQQEAREAPPSGATAAFGSWSRTYASASSEDASDDSNKHFDQDKFVAKQKRTSSEVRRRTMATASVTAADAEKSASKSEKKEGEEERKFLNHQRGMFDDMADWFASHESVPLDLVPTYEHLANRVVSESLRGCTGGSGGGLDEGEGEETTASDRGGARRCIRILDAGCGTGSFFKYLVAAADSGEWGDVDLDITGVDLSSKMVEFAQQNAEEVLKQSGGGHSIRVLESDVLRYSPPPPGEDAIDDDDDSHLFDAVLANACFGNFYDQASALRHLASLLRATATTKNGKLFVTHPLGVEFVNEKLHAEDPVTVPHKLPASEGDWYPLLVSVPLHLDTLEKEATVAARGEENGRDEVGESVQLYFASLHRVRYAMLERVVRLRGTVDAGYGRGGKKLGFPTANLPSGRFQDALEGVTPGVYFGWAVLEKAGSSGDDGSHAVVGRDVPHKAVVNVGYSPTFEGQENPEKIVEAHLILDDGALEPADFYGETMRLQLLAFLRPEMKFPSFDKLIAQISADKADSDHALDLPPFSQLRSDEFLRSDVNRQWVGKSGGNDDSSWEFQSMKDFLKGLYVYYCRRSYGV